MIRMQAVIAVLVGTTAFALPVQDMKMVVPVVDNRSPAKHTLNMQALASPAATIPPQLAPKAGWWGGDQPAPSIDKSYYKDQVANSTMDQGKVPPPSFPQSYYKGIYFRPFGMKDTLDIKKGRKTLEKYKARARAEFTEQENRLAEYEAIVKDRETKIAAIKAKFPSHPEVIGPLDHYLNGDLATYKMKLVTHKKVAKIYLDNYLDYIDNYETWAGLTDEDYARQAMYESRINRKGDELEKRGASADKELEPVAKRAAGFPMPTASAFPLSSNVKESETLVGQIEAESTINEGASAMREAGTTFWKATVAPEHPRLQAEVERTVTKPDYMSEGIKVTHSEVPPPTPPQALSAMGLEMPSMLPVLDSKAVNLLSVKDLPKDERKQHASKIKVSPINAGNIEKTASSNLFSTHDKVVPDSMSDTNEAMSSAAQGPMVSGI